MNPVLYRYERGGTFGGEAFIFLRRVTILRRTSKGVWVDNHGQEKWVRYPNGKWASATVEEAQRRFTRRSEVCVKRSQADLLAAERYYAAALAGKWTDNILAYDTFPTIVDPLEEEGN